MELKCFGLKWKYFKTFDIVLQFHIWTYLKIFKYLGHSIISHSFGVIIISKSFEIDKALFRNSEIGPKLITFGAINSFIKFWGQTIILENSAL